MNLHPVLTQGPHPLGCHLILQQNNKVIATEINANKGVIENKQTSNPICQNLTRSVILFKMKHTTLSGKQTKLPKHCRGIEVNILLYCVLCHSHYLHISLGHFWRNNRNLISPAKLNRTAIHTELNKPLLFQIPPNMMDKGSCGKRFQLSAQIQ